MSARRFLKNSLLLAGFVFGTPPACITQPRSQTIAPEQHNKMQVVVDCAIFDFRGVLIRNYPGSLCAFVPDGSLLVGTGKP